MAPIFQAIVLVSFLMWQFQLSLSSIVRPSDFVVKTCSTRVPSIVTDGGAVRVFSLGPDLIKTNLVLISLLLTSLSAYVRCMSPANILGS